MHLKFTAGNLPVPAGPRAPITPSWFFTHAPFAAVVAGYRLIPARLRRGWNRNNGYASTSHTALGAILRPTAQGGGRPAFVRYTTPQFSGRRQPRGYGAAWAVLLVAIVAEHDHGVSWAN